MRKEHKLCWWWLRLLGGRLRLYRSGVFEYGWRFINDDWRNIPASALLEHAHDALLYFASVYAQVGYHGRVRTFIGIDNADEGVFWIPRELADPEHWSAEQETGCSRSSRRWCAAGGMR
jgi:hypothetical protein